MAPELLAQQRRHLADAPTGFGGRALEAVRSTLLESGEGDQPLQPCDISVVMVGTESCISRRVAAWRGLRRCEA